MFDNFTVTQLKHILRTYKEHHSIPKYSTMKKKDLIDALNKSFEIRDNILYAKKETKIEFDDLDTSKLKKLEHKYDLIYSDISNDETTRQFWLQRKNTDNGKKNLKLLTDRIAKKRIQERKLYKQLQKLRPIVATIEEKQKDVKEKKKAVKKKVAKKEDMNEEVYEKYEQKYLSDYLGYTEAFKIDDDNIISLDNNKVNVYNKLFDVLDNLYTKDEVHDYYKYLDGDTLEYFREWADKKINAGHGIEYTDFVTLVVFPRMMKNVITAGDKKKVDKVKLMMFANEVPLDGGFKNYNIGPINRYRLINTFVHKPKTGVSQQLRKNKQFEDVLKPNIGWI